MNRPYYDAAIETHKPAAPPKPDTRPRFIPAAHFSGARAGYIFKAGQPGPAVRPGHPSFVPAGSGTGYYLDISGGASELSEKRARDAENEAALRKAGFDV